MFRVSKPNKVSPQSILLEKVTKKKGKRIDRNSAQRIVVRYVFATAENQIQRDKRARNTLIFNNISAIFLLVVDARSDSNIYITLTFVK